MWVAAVPTHSHINGRVSSQRGAVNEEITPGGLVDKEGTYLRQIGRGITVVCVIT